MAKNYCEGKRPDKSQPIVVGYKKFIGDPRMSDSGVVPVFGHPLVDPGIEFTVDEPGENDGGGGGLLSGIAGFFVDAIKGYAGD